jgi:hypothetical protein
MVLVALGGQTPTRAGEIHLVVPNRILGNDDYAIVAVISNLIYTLSVST